LRDGKGPEAKKGKTVHVYYSGRLQKNNKQFDACVTGKPFKFRLGAGEVIKGWDVGVENMKVGGKRQLIIPPHMAYGSKGAGKDIPGNSTLIFDVELKAVN
jgi:FK506-binding nuclear protein